MNFIDGGACESFEIVERLIGVRRLRCVVQKLFKNIGQRLARRSVIRQRLQVSVRLARFFEPVRAEQRNDLLRIEARGEQQVFDVRRCHNSMIR